MDVTPFFGFRHRHFLRPWVFSVIFLTKRSFIAIWSEYNDDPKWKKLIGLKRIVNVLVTHIEVFEWIFLGCCCASQPFRLFSWRIGGRNRCVLFKLANDPPSIEGFGVVHEFSFFLFFTFHIVPWPSFLPSLSACSRWCLKGKKKMEGGVLHHSLFCLL